MTLMEPIKTKTEAGVIRCRAGDLRNAVAAASQVIERPNTIPVLSCLHINPEGKDLLISGTNLDTWLSVECPAQHGECQQFCIDALAMKRLLAWAPVDDEVTITKEKDLLTIQIGKVTAQKRALIPAADWPEIPQILDVRSMLTAIGEAALVKMIDSVRFAISTEETRYYLNGIYLTAIDGHLATVATDGHKLARYISAEPWRWPSVIFPREAVQALRNRLVPGGNRPVHVKIDDKGNRIEFWGDGWSLVSKLIDGTFPDYTRVIPPRADNPGYAVLSLETLRRLPAPIRNSSNAIKLDLSAARASFQDVLNSMDVSLPIEARGDFAIGFNGNYLRQIARAFGTIRVEATSVNDAAHMLTEDPALTIVLMPMRLG